MLYFKNSIDNELRNNHFKQKLIYETCNLTLRLKNFNEIL